nr:hypothetical protein [Acidobacteriota bacterium]
GSDGVWPSREAGTLRTASATSRLVSSDAATAPTSRNADPGGVVPAAWRQSGRPSIEGLNRPEARVYQMDGDQFSVVMIVDEKLNV